MLVGGSKFSRDANHVFAIDKFETVVRTAFATQLTGSARCKMIVVSLGNIVNIIPRDVGCCMPFMASIIAFLAIRDKRGEWPFGECDPPPPIA